MYLLVDRAAGSKAAVRFQEDCAIHLCVVARYSRILAYSRELACTAGERA